MKTNIKLRKDEAKMLKIAAIGIVSIIVILFLAIAVFALAGDTNPPSSHQGLINIQIDGGTYEINMSKNKPIEPTVEPLMQPDIVENESGTFPDAHGGYLYDYTNNTYQVVNKTNTPTPIPDNILEARRLGWTSDLGSADEFIYKYNLAHGYIKPKPELTLTLLNENKEPWDWQREVIVPSTKEKISHVCGYVRITNNADWAYQGDVDIYINASLFFGGGLTHMENNIKTVTVSIPPKNYNEFYERLEVPYDISTGVYEIIIELREKEHGTTIYSYRLTPAVAKISEDGTRYF